MAIQDFPLYEQALESLCNVLKAYGAPSNVVWVAPEHTVMCGRDWGVFDGEFVAVEEVKAVYDRARQNGAYGVKLGLLCIDNSNSYCYIYVPPTLIDAEYSLMLDRAVKISIPTNIPRGRTIDRHGFRAAWYLAWERRLEKLKAAAFGRP